MGLTMLGKASKISILIIALAAFCSVSGASDSSLLKIATTSSLYDTGLLEMLAQNFSLEQSVTVQIPTHSGTGIAISDGERGNVDLLVIHDKKRELKFVQDGHGLERRCLAYNYFYLVGPKDDPAKVAGMNVTAALKAISKKGQASPEEVKFVSRGDDSGTHSKEKSLWQSAGYNYSEINNSGQWYIDAGSPMGATLIMADEKSAYTLTDMSTFMAFKSKLDLVPYVEGGSDMLNVYVAIALDPKKHPGVNCELANRFIDFLVSDEGQRLIASYGRAQYGQPIFFAAQGNCSLIGCSAEECAVPTTAACAA
jgi:tungstate transport system substrate-binding protein